MSIRHTVKVVSGEDTPLSSLAQLSAVVPQFGRAGYELSCWIDGDGNTYTDTIRIDRATVISAVWKSV